MHLSSKGSGDNLSEFKDLINKGLDILAAEEAKLKKAAQDTCPAILPVVDCNQFGKRTAISYYSEKPYSFYSSGKYNVEETCKVATDLAEKWKKEGEEIHLKNVPAIENNTKIIDYVKLLMTRIGIPSSYTTLAYATNRSRNKTSTKHNAGYLEDLTRNVKTYDGYKAMLADYTKMLAEIAAYKKSEGDKESAIKAAKAIKDKEDQAKVLLGVFYGKYGLPITAGKGDVLDAILEKNKYLRLSHYMAKNRDDWNDGPSYAETGLNGFKVENEKDQEIYDEINGHITDWDGDGRIFRDCTWNYSVIMGLVEDKGLLDDYSKYMKILGDDY